MTELTTTIMAPLARWSSRIALFSASILLVAVVLHRLTPFPTSVALNLFLVGVAGAGLSVLAGLIALAQIWRRGYGGAGSAAAGVLLPLVALAWPLTYVPAYFNLPPINDVTTDLATPPRFVALAKEREGDANFPTSPSARFPAEQQKAYPELRTFVLDRSAQEAFELVEDAVRKLKWKVAVSEPPAMGRAAKGGTLEASDTTLVAGFTDDIVIRVEGSANRSRIDVRSASRFGRHDLGTNATRVRRFFAELQNRIDSTGPSGVAGRRGLRTTRTGAMVKKVKGHNPEKAESRSERSRAQSSAQRGRGQKETQR
jgi:Protein of unknown function (DUF1499)